MRARFTRSTIAGLVLAAVGAVVLAAAGVALRRASIDLDGLRAPIVEAVEAATGRRFVLAGRARLALAPGPRVLVEDVRLANAPWGSRPEMLAARRIELELEWLPLLAGRVVVRRLVLEAPEVLVETDARGRGNWAFAGAADGAAVPPFALDEIRLRHGRLIYRDGTSGRRLSITIDEGRIAAEKRGGGFAVAVSGAVDGRPVSVEGRFGPFAAFAGARPLALDLRLRSGDLSFVLAGRVADLPMLAGLDLAVGVEGKDLRAFGGLFGGALPDLGAFQLSGHLSGSAARPRFDSLVGRAGRADRASLSVEGSVAEPAAGRGLDLTVAVVAPGLDRLGVAFGVALPETAPLAATARLRDRDGHYRIDDLAATIGESDFAGSLTIAPAAARPRIEADLIATRVDFDALFGGGAGRAVEAEAKAKEKEKPEAAAGGGRLFPAEPIDFALLDALDLRLRLRADRLRAGGFAFADSDLRLTLERGAGVLRVVRARYGEGDFAGALRIDARARPSAVALDLEADSFDVGRLLADLGWPDLVEGRAEVAIDVAGAGGSVAEVMASLDGRARFAMGPGRIATRYVDLFAADLFQSLDLIARGEDDARVNCLIARFEIADGTGEGRDLLLDTRRTTVTGSGRVALGAETVDLLLAPRPRDPSLMSLATPIRVSGPLAAPNVAPDALSVARAAGVAVLGALATGGIGIVAPFLSMGTGNGDVCRAAREALRDPPREARAEPEPAPEGRVDGGFAPGAGARQGGDGR